MNFNTILAKVTINSYVKIVPFHDNYIKPNYIQIKLYKTIFIHKLIEHYLSTNYRTKLEPYNYFVQL